MCPNMLLFTCAHLWVHIDPQMRIKTQGSSQDMGEKITGGCLCSGVRYEVSGKLRDVITCHCAQCRRTSGHFVAATACRKANFMLTDQSSLRWYSAVPGFRRGFCSQCGSSLFFEEVGGPRMSVAAGTLDRPHGLKIAAQIFVAEAGDYYGIDDKVPCSQGGDHAVELP